MLYKIVVIIIYPIFKNLYQPSQNTETPQESTSLIQKVSNIAGKFYGKKDTTQELNKCNQDKETMALVAVPRASRSKYMKGGAPGRTPKLSEKYRMARKSLDIVRKQMNTWYDNDKNADQSSSSVSVQPDEKKNDNNTNWRKSMDIVQKYLTFSHSEDDQSNEKQILTSRPVPLNQNNNPTWRNSVDVVTIVPLEENNNSDPESQISAPKTLPREKKNENSLWRKSMEIVQEQLHIPDREVKSPKTRMQLLAPSTTQPRPLPQSSSTSATTSQSPLVTKTTKKEPENQDLNKIVLKEFTTPRERQTLYIYSDSVVIVKEKTMLLIRKKYKKIKFQIDHRRILHISKSSDIDHPNCLVIFGKVNEKEVSYYIPLMNENDINEALHIIQYEKEIFDTHPSHKEILATICNPSPPDNRGTHRATKDPSIFYF